MISLAQSSSLVILIIAWICIVHYNPIQAILFIQSEFHLHLFPSNIAQRHNTEIILLDTLSNILTQSY